MRSNYAVGVVLALGASAAAVAGGPAHYLSGWTPTAGQVRDIEHRVSLPAGADPLPTYERYYAGTYEGGRRIIVGTFVGFTKLPRQGFVKIVSFDRMPELADFGCGVIRIKYEPAARKVSSASCNSGGSPPPPPHPL